MNVKSRVFRAWVASYALILIIPILIGSVVYIQSVKTISEEVDRAHTMSLNQLKSVMDGKFEELSRLGSVVGLNQDIRKLMYGKKSLETIDIYTIVHAQKDLTKFKISNSFIDDIYIYINNYMFTSTYKYAEDEIEEVSEDKFLLSYAELNRLIHVKQFNTCRLLRKDMGKGNNKSEFVFMQSLYLDDYNKPAGTMIVTVDGDKLSGLLKNLKWTAQGDVVLINSRNEFYNTGSTGKIPVLDGFDKLRKSDNTFYIKQMKNNIAVTHLTSGALDIEYVSLMPTKVFLQRVQYIKNIIYIYIVVCLLVGIITAYVLAKKNYRPVKNLTQLYINALGKSSNGQGNEFRFLEDSLRSLLEQNDNFVTRLKQQKDAMRNNLFVKLFKGRVRNLDGIRDSLHSFDIEFKSQNYFVAAFKIEHFSNNFLRDTISQNDDEMELIYFIIRNVFEELVNEKHIGFVVEIDGLMVCLVNLVSDDMQIYDRDSVINELTQSLNRGKDFIESKFDIVLSIAESDVHFGTEGIAKAYSEVLEVFEYKTLVGDQDRIISYHSIQSNTEIYINDKNLEKQRQFINCIRAEDYKHAGEILDDIITNDIGRNKSLQLAKCHMFGLINSMINAIGEIVTTPDLEFFENLNPANRLLSSKSVGELKDQVDYIFGRITEYFEEKEKTQAPAWIFDAEDYVKNNYYKPDLSIANISQKLDISVSYLSRTYKRYKGIGLLDYVHKVRLDKAKNLMNNNDMNLNEIAEKVGYLESKALIRAFKRYEGITPGRFRDTE